MTTTLTSPTPAIVTTVHITWTSAAKIRMHANEDLPEYGIKAGENFYLVRSSENTGLYYIVRWDYAKISWQCPCKHSVERPAAKPCRHKRLVSKDCKAHKAAITKADEQKAVREAERIMAATRTVTSIERKLSACGLMKK